MLSQSHYKGFAIPAEAGWDQLSCLESPCYLTGVFFEGPWIMPSSRLKGRTRWQLLLRGKTSQALRAVLWTALRMPTAELGSGVRLHADVDPASTL